MTVEVGTTLRPLSVSSNTERGVASTQHLPPCYITRLSPSFLPHNFLCVHVCRESLGTRVAVVTTEKHTDNI